MDECNCKAASMINVDGVLHSVRHGDCFALLSLVVLVVLRLMMLMLVLLLLSFCRNNDPGPVSLPARTVCLSMLLLAPFSATTSK